MRRLLALGLGCLVSFTAASEDLLTIFDQAVINDPQVREAEFTRRATREARPQAWAAYLPQIGGRWTRSESDTSRTSVEPVLVPTDPANPTTSPLIIQRVGQNGAGSPETTQWQLQLTQSIFNWGQLVQVTQAVCTPLQADAHYG